jgi:hypothetical protein
MIIRRAEIRPLLMVLAVALAPAVAPGCGGKSCDFPTDCTGKNGLAFSDVNDINHPDAYICGQLGSVDTFVGTSTNQFVNWSYHDSTQDWLCNCPVQNGNLEGCSPSMVH